MQYNILHYKESIVKSYFSFSDFARTIFYHIKNLKSKRFGSDGDKKNKRPHFA